MEKFWRKLTIQKWQLGRHAVNSFGNLKHFARRLCIGRLKDTCSNLQKIWVPVVFLAE